MTKTALSFAALLAALILPPVPAMAQGAPQFTPPEGCEAFLTVQSRGCTVSHMWTCEADPEGHHWRLVMDQEGPSYLAMTDSEYRWLLSYGLRGGSQNILVEPEEDPASLTELLATGSDSMVYSVITEDGAGQRVQRDYTGFDALTGEEVVIDGETLARTRFSYEYDLGNGPRRVEGGQFVSESLRMFFGGQEVVTLPTGEQIEVDNTPMEFARPGERGFLTTQPLYDCGDMMS